MKKKKSILLLSIIFFSFFLVSCTKKPEISAKEAGVALVDAFIYQKDSKAFKENFKDGETLLKNMQESREAFTTEFANSMAAQHLEKEKAQEIIAALEEELKGKSSFQVEVKNEEKTKATISYEINGLSYDGVISGVLTQLIDASKKDDTLVKNEEKMLQFIAEKLPTEMKNISKREEAVTVLMELSAKGGKWQVAKDENAAFQELFLAFITGVTNENEFESQMKETMNKINQELKKDSHEEKK